MTDPNANATAESVADQIAGTLEGTPLSYEEAAMFYQSRMFGLSKDYAEPQGSYTSPAMPDHVTALAKLLTRLTEPMADGNIYDALDMLRTCTKYVLSQNVHINDDEIDSVNYEQPA